jgi:hypothetical protein
MLKMQNLSLKMQILSGYEREEGTPVLKDVPVVYETPYAFSEKKRLETIQKLKGSLAVGGNAVGGVRGEYVYTPPMIKVDSIPEVIPETKGGKMKMVNDNPVRQDQAAAVEERNKLKDFMDQKHNEGKAKENVNARDVKVTLTVVKYRTWTCQWKHQEGWDPGAVQSYRAKRKMDTKKKRSWTKITDLWVAVDILGEQRKKANSMGYT